MSWLFGWWMHSRRRWAQEADVDSMAGEIPEYIVAEEAP